MKSNRKISAQSKSPDSPKNFNPSAVTALAIGKTTGNQTYFGAGEITESKYGALASFKVK
jgi:hypothetical protein